MLRRCLGVLTLGITNTGSRVVRKEIDRITRNMAGVSDGVTLKCVVKAMNDFAHVSLAENWDNVGLLIEPTTPRSIRHVLLTNDLTERVMQEAIDLNVEMIVSYHPPIFAPMKRITNDNWKERIAAKCLENKIALYSPHTSFDSIKGGVNDWLAETFDIKTCKPIQPGAIPENGMGRICELKKTISPDEAAALVKLRTGLSHVRLARSVNPEKPIETVAVCAGSGASVLKNIPADLYLTGEMLHHDILDAVHRDIHVILTNHSDSERGYLKDFAKILSTSLKECVRISVSEQDADPLTTV